MSRLDLRTAGESHGPAELAILSGIPAQLPLKAADIDEQLARRQRGYGRGGRQQIELDRIRILSGVRGGLCTGAPIALLIENKDHANWLEIMSPETRDPAAQSAGGRVTVPRPGHADLAGIAKFDFEDARDVLERSSARATAARVAAGAVARRLLADLGIEVRGRVLAVGSAPASKSGDYLDPQSVDWERADASDVGTDDAEAEAAMRAEVDRAREAGVSLGGIFEVWAWGLPPGLGSYTSAEERLDGRLAGAVMSIPAIKGVEVGLGFRAAVLPGTQVHDPLYPVRAGEGGPRYRRGSNRAGGLEGGVTNGSPVVLRAAMKPIPTMKSSLPSLDVLTWEESPAHRERADVEAVSAARVVAEAETCLVLADALLCKFGGDTLADLRLAYANYVERLKKRGLWPSS
ncbi:MAG: chorismate synthase [Thermoleophilia bacterium]